MKDIDMKSVIIGIGLLGSCFLLILGYNSHFFEKKLNILEAKGRWVYEPSILANNKSSFEYHGGGEISMTVKTNKGGEITGILNGEIKTYYRCLRKQGCIQADTNEIIPYLQRILKFEDEINGQIFGSYNGEKVFYSRLEILIKNEFQEIPESYELKGKIENNKIKGIFSEGYLERSKWKLFIVN